MEAGACGYLMKSASSEELAVAVQRAHRGHRVLAPEVTIAMVTDPSEAAPGGDLTTRERELLALMARGLSNLQISTQLSIAMPTVKFHVTNILIKLHANNRTEAVLVALKHKLVVLN